MYLVNGLAALISSDREQFVKVDQHQSDTTMACMGHLYSETVERF